MTLSSSLRSILSPVSPGSPYRMNSPRLEHDDDANDKDRGGAELVTSDGRALPLVSASLRAEAGGGLARVVLEQTFENTHQETLHVIYKMPLPADGAVSGYEFSIGQRVVKGRVEPKQVARAQFEQAIADGRTAGLLEQQRADIFTQEIGNIPAGETIVARITVDQRLAWLSEGEWELRFPTVIGPRYIGAEVKDPSAVKVDVAAKEDVRARIHLAVSVHDELASGRNVTSPSHLLEMLPPPCIKPHSGYQTGILHNGTTQHVSLRAIEGARLDRDIVVRWPVAEAEVGVSLSLARPKSTQANAHLAYGLVTIVPPTADSLRQASRSGPVGISAGPAPLARVLPRDLIVLIDTSGSMGGGPLDQAKKVVSLLVDSLGAEDRLQLVEFSSRPTAWQQAPAFTTPETKKRALAWIDKLRAGGATEMYTAIVEGLKSLRPGAQRQVVLVTDGYIGGEQQIVELLHERLPEDCRMHVVGVGSAVNRALATSLSRAGRGAEVLVGLDEDAERGAKRLLNRTAQPVLTNVTVEGDAIVELAPQHVPDVFAGAPVVLAVKLSAEGGDMIVRGTLANGTWEKKLHVPAMNQGEGNQAIVALFGREHVADLEMRWTIGRETEMIDRMIERVGTVFQIATRMTSWVAIDDVRTVDPKSGSRLVTQPQELPYGTTIESFGLGSAGGGGGGSQMTRAGSITPEGRAYMEMLMARPAPIAPPVLLAGPVPAAGFGAPPGGAGAGGPSGGPPPAARSAPLPPSMIAPSSSLEARPEQQALGRASRPSPLPQYMLPVAHKRAMSKRGLAIVFFVMLFLLALAVLAWFLFR